MGKELSEMTLEELWELFPIFLVEHTDKWADDYKEIEILLQDLFASCPIHRISHIGSTTIKGIWAKNIVDVMVEIPESSSLKYGTGFGTERFYHHVLRSKPNFAQ